MKKFVVISLFADLIIVVVAISMFACNSNDLPEQQIVDICKIIIQATIAGAITFAGLLLTFFSQEQQAKNKNQLDLCPCFVVESCSSLSAVMEHNNVAKNSNILRCSTATSLRTVECTIINCKDNYGLNVNLKTLEGTYKLGNIKTEKTKLTLAINGVSEEILAITFEDVYGHKYEQNIKYAYQNPNHIVFTSNQPKRRK